MLDQHLGVLAGKVVADADGHLVCGRVVEIVAPLGLIIAVRPNDRPDDGVYLWGKGSAVEGLGCPGVAEGGLVDDGDLVDGTGADTQDQRGQGNGCKTHLDVDEQVVSPNIHDRDEKTRYFCNFKLCGIGRDFIPLESTYTANHQGP